MRSLGTTGRDMSGRRLCGLPGTVEAGTAPLYEASQEEDAAFESGSEEDQAVTCSLIQFGMGAAPSWAPVTGFASLLAGYRSDKLVTVVGGVATGWGDLSGNGVNLTSSAGPTYSAVGGVNGLPKLSQSGNGNSKYLSNTSFVIVPDNDIEIFGVATPSSTGNASGAYLCDLGANNDAILLEASVTNLVIYNGSLFNFGSATATDPFCADCFHDGTSDSFGILNGGTVQSGTIGTASQASTTLTIGNYEGLGDGWQGDIYELWICGATQSASARAAWLEYVSARYGIAT